MDELEEQIKYQVLYPLVDKVSQIKWQIEDAVRYLRMSLDTNNSTDADNDDTNEYDDSEEE